MKLIEKGACIYVCGDAKNMAKDVMQALISAFQTARQMDEQEAKKAVIQLQIEKRYLQDIWTWKVHWKPIFFFFFLFD